MSWYVFLVNWRLVTNTSTGRVLGSILVVKLGELISSVEEDWMKLMVNVRLVRWC